MQLGFHFDQKKCTGCYACAIACKDWHDTPAGPARWMQITYKEEGRFPDLFVSHMVTPCYHCEEPICSFVCPNEAVSKRDEDGVVVVDGEKCREEKTCGIIVGEGKNGLYGEQTAPCQVSCPAHLHIPAYVALIAKGKNREALDLIRRRMPLPSVCGRVCLHPCESDCRRQDLDEPIAIMALKGFVSDNVPAETPDKIEQTQPDKVAVIGAGPAGLAAAYDLIRAGYAVTVFDSAREAGGMLSAAVPEHRLPGAVLQRDIAYLTALGIEIRMSTTIDLGKGLDGLLAEGYGAVLLALGAHKGQKLDIPGTGIAATDVGTDFMKDVRSGKLASVGGKVLVVGGGNVAIDCARSARRLGATTVNVVCLEGRDEMPADEAEISQAEEEGVGIHCSRTLTGIGEGCVECVNIDGLKFDDGGRPKFSAVDGSGHKLEADHLIFAIGQAPELDGLASDIGTEDGRIAADAETMMTGRRGIFSAGDAVHGATSAIDAIASGQQAAFYINRYLQGDVLRVRQEASIAADTIEVDIPADKEKQAREIVPVLPVAERLSGFTEVSLGYSAEAAVREAERCLNCAGHLCKDACPYSAPQFADEEKARMQKCDLCYDRFPEGKRPICVEACPPRALDAGDIEEMKKKHGTVTSAYAFTYSSVAKPSLVTTPKIRVAR